jgi:trichothecene efflux pump TRI12
LTLPGGFGLAGILTLNTDLFYILIKLKAGGFFAGMTIGRYKWMNTTWCLTWGTVFKTVADYPMVLVAPTGAHTKAYGMGLGFLSMFGTGWTGVALLVCVQLDCRDADIGMATLVLGAVRAIGGSVAITIYSTILNNALTKYAGVYVAKAVIPLGYSITGLEALALSIINEDYTGAQKLPGVTPAIYEAAKLAIEKAWTKGFHQIYICSASFAAASIIAAALTRDVSKNMTDHVAVRLLNEKPRSAKVETLEEAPTRTTATAE